MATSELSLEEVHEYFLEKGGIVANRDVVKYFKRYLTDPEAKDDARIKFKKYINTLATTRTEGDEKFLILRPKYSLDSTTSQQEVSNDTSSTQAELNQSPSRQPPPYRPPPPPPPPVSYSPSPSLDNISFSSFQDAPQAPPRKKSTEKRIVQESEVVENEKPEEEKQTGISVKERLQKFNRLASVENDTSPRQQKEKKKSNEKGADEDDGASVTSLDQKRCTEWYVTAAKGDYQELAKLAVGEPRLVKIKDPFTYTVLHWGAKHGNEDIIKLFAGKYKADVNAKTNGGYTPLHLAAQLGHDKVYDLLVQVYKADPRLTDFSGRTPSRYKTSQVQTGNKDTYRKIKARKKASDKDLGFLRIGSLNVRVKKTTEAFSNFLGVGGSSIIPSDPLPEKVHKSWGSADNIPHDNMPAPKAYLIKRKSKKSLEGANSIPGTPNQIPRSRSQRNSMQDSDSDTAAGFDSNWRYT